MIEVRRNRRVRLAGKHKYTLFRVSYFTSHIDIYLYHNISERTEVSTATGFSITTL